MPLRFPPVAALRALEVSARHLSFTKAAEEIGVTQSAISHQIRHLEDLWGLKLFNRPPGGLVLTRNGQALAAVARNFLDQLSTTLDDLQNEDTRVPLRVDTLQSFAVKWLVPRLRKFYDLHSDVDVWISTHDEVIDIASHDIDVAIRLGHGDYPGLHSTLLLNEYVFPVCSPEFLKHHPKPERPADLLSLPLLLRLGDPAHPNWENWFERAGLTQVMLIEGPRFPDSNMALQAAIEGQGVALARSAHVASDLRAKRLVKLFDIQFPSSVSYHLVCPMALKDTPKIVTFRNWITAEAVVAQAEYDALASLDKVT